MTIKIAPVFGFFEDPLEIEEGKEGVEFTIKHKSMPVEDFCDSIEDLQRKLIAEGYVNATVENVKSGVLRVRAVSLPQRKEQPKETEKAPRKKRQRRSRKS